MGTHPHCYHITARLIFTGLMFSEWFSSNKFTLVLHVGQTHQRYDPLGTIYNTPATQLHMITLRLLVKLTTFLIFSFMKAYSYKGIDLFLIPNSLLLLWFCSNSPSFTTLCSFLTRSYLFTNIFPHKVILINNFILPMVLSNTFSLLKLLATSHWTISTMWFSIPLLFIFCLIAFVSTSSFLYWWWLKVESKCLKLNSLIGFVTILIGFVTI